MDIESMRAPMLDAYQQGPDALVALVVTLLSAVAVRVTALEEEHARLHARLETNSGTSSKPPHRMHRG